MDCEKIKNELDWTPQYAFKEALDEMWPGIEVE